MKIEKFNHRVARRLLIALAVLLMAQLEGMADIVPANRVTPWRGNVGVEGGIPNSSNMPVYATVTVAQGAAGINSALAACPSNQVVQLQAGTYNISTVINFAKNGTVLRGAGPGKTILKLSGNAGISITGPARYDIPAVGAGTPNHVANWTGGLAQGSTSIVLDSVTGLTVGKLICLDQVNDGNDVDSTGCGICGRGNQRSQQQFVKVRAISGNTVTISSPVYMPNWRASQFPQAWWQDGALLEKCGVEDLTIDGQNGGYSGDGYGANVFMTSAYNCWVKNIKSLWGGGVCHLNPLGGVARCEFRHNTFYEGKGTEHMSYGLMFFSCSGCLMEDNIFESIVGPYVGGGSPSGNAISYSFSTNNPYMSGGTAYQTQLITTHDAHHTMLLCEGNYGNGFYGDYYHGSMGYTTLFRNRFTGYDRGTPNNSWCVGLSPKNRNVNIVGNILGTPGWTTAYSLACGGLQVYSFGCGSSYGVPDDTVVSSSAYIHGNYDVVNKSVLWASSNTDHNIPASLLYTSKPDWFGDRPWPPFDPANGASIAANKMAMTNIPAGYRYIYGIDPPTGPVNQAPVARAAATPTSGVVPLTVSFSSAGSSDPEGTALTYTWNFGDGSVSTAANPSHVYSAPGNYTAQLTVSDGVNSSMSSPLSISVSMAGSNSSPGAVASANPTVGVAPLAVTFSSVGSADPEGTALTYSWMFGDGATSTAANPAHTYATPGVYTAKLIVSDGTNASAPSTVTITVSNVRGMVAAYGFEEGTGSRVSDASGLGNTGTLIGTSWVKGKYGQGLSFNGTNSVITINDSASLDLAAGMTLECWVYPTALNGVTDLIFKDGESYYLVGSVSAGSGPVMGGSFSGTYLSGPTALPLNSWSHLAATYDGNNMILYVNGVQVGSRTQTGAITSSAGPLMLGGNALVSGKGWAGLIDEVRVYNRALSPTEIQTDISNPVSATAKPAPPQGFRVVGQ